MSRILITLKTNADKDKAIAYVNAAPAGTRVEIKAATRTLSQNDRLWGTLGDVADQMEWHGEKLSPNDWKCIFIAALKKELRIVPNIDNDGFVIISQSSSDLTKDEMSNLFELIMEFGARHGVKFYDDYKKLGVRSDG